MPDGRGTYLCGVGSAAFLVAAITGRAQNLNGTGEREQSSSNAAYLLVVVASTIASSSGGRRSCGNGKSHGKDVKEHGLLHFEVS